MTDISPVEALAKALPEWTYENGAPDLAERIAANILSSLPEGWHLTYTAPEGHNHVWYRLTLPSMVWRDCECGEPYRPAVSL